MSIAYYYYRSKKIDYIRYSELVEKINNLEATEIISIKPCIPDATDTRFWVSVYYEYQG